MSNPPPNPEPASGPSFEVLANMSRRLDQVMADYRAVVEERDALRTMSVTTWEELMPEMEQLFRDLEKSSSPKDWVLLKHIENGRRLLFKETELRKPQPAMHLAAQSEELRKCLDLAYRHLSKAEHYSVEMARTQIAEAQRLCPIQFEDNLHATEREELEPLPKTPFRSFLDDHEAEGRDAANFGLGGPAIPRQVHLQYGARFWCDHPPDTSDKFNADVRLATCLDCLRRALLASKEEARVVPTDARGVELPPNPEPKCSRCQGCGSIADSETGEPWTYWRELPPGSDVAVVRAGIVKPIRCPACNGRGVA